jgi:hypothetical protein
MLKLFGNLENPSKGDYSSVRQLADGRVSRLRFLSPFSNVGAFFMIILFGNLENPSKGDYCNVRQLANGRISRCLFYPSVM